MADEVTGYQIVDVGQIGAADGGKIVYFDLKDPQANAVRVMVPFNKMSSVLAKLAAALELATAEQAKRPGFDPSHSAFKVGVKSFRTGRALAPSLPGMVSLQIDTNGIGGLALLLSRDQATKLGTELVSIAETLDEHKIRPS